MKSEIIKKSICSTCNQLENCLTNRCINEPVLFCEEFDNYLPNSNIPEKKNAEENIDNKKDKSITGLCVNCENRDDCTIRDEHTVIWHCEEYL